MFVLVECTSICLHLFGLQFESHNSLEILLVEGGDRMLYGGDMLIEF